MSVVFERDCDIVPSGALHWRPLRTKAAFSVALALISAPERPHDIHPDTVMPNMDLPDQEAHDIAAYLYTLR
jgi:hypothetical protein